MDEYLQGAGIERNAGVSLGEGFLMDTPSNDALLIMWITFTGVAALGVIGVLIWAVRSRQFSNQDHARYLPLSSGISKEAAEAGGKNAANGDKNVPA